MISHVHHSFHLAEQVTDEDTTVGPPQWRGTVPTPLTTWGRWASTSFPPSMMNSPHQRKRGDTMSEPIIRCFWVNLNNPAYVKYHDEE